jgi:hypothetical protein
MSSPQISMTREERKGPTLTETPGLARVNDPHLPRVFV